MKISLLDCWKKINYKEVNKIAIDSLLIDGWSSTLIGAYLDDLDYSPKKMLEDFDKHFEEVYRDVNLYNKNYGKASLYNPIEKELNNDTIGTYGYMATMYIASYCRRNCYRLGDKYPKTLGAQLDFKEDEVEVVLLEDLMKNGAGALIFRLGNIGFAENIFSNKYNISKIDLSGYKVEKELIISALFCITTEHISNMFKSSMSESTNREKICLEMVNSIEEDFKKVVDDYEARIVDKDKEKIRLNKELSKLKKDKEEQDKTVEELLSQIMALERENSLLKDKNAIYELEVSSEEEKEVAQEIFDDEAEGIDLNNYKIIVITCEDDKSKYTLPILDLTNSTARINKLLSCDLVAFDCNHNSHHCYWQVKQFCKSNGIRFAHMTCSPNNMEKELKKYILSRSI